LNTNCIKKQVSDTDSSEPLVGRNNTLKHKVKQTRQNIIIGKYRIHVRKKKCPWRLLKETTKDYEIHIFASSLTTHLSGERAKTGWLGISIMCPSRETCLSADCCFSELALLVNTIKHRGVVREITEKGVQYGNHRGLNI
jgi:hypothetical protein